MFTFDWAVIRGEFDPTNDVHLVALAGIVWHWTLTLMCLTCVFAILFELSRIASDVAELVDPRTFVETDEKSR